MQYDPIKRRLGKMFNQAPWLRIIFYKLLDLLLLRSWHIRRELKTQLIKIKGRKVKILDAGFGFGQYTYFLAKLPVDSEIKGIDLKDEQVEDCSSFFKKLGLKNVSFQTADLTTYHEDNSFDLIVCVDVMEHILEDVQVFRNFAASLQAGGLLLISTPSDQGGSDVHDHSGDGFIEEHVRVGYSISEMEEKLRTAGFSHSECRYSYGPWGRISWRLSMKYPLLLVNISKFFLLVLPFYYMITFPFSYLFNYLDVKLRNRTGTGLIVKAYK